MPMVGRSYNELCADLLRLLANKVDAGEAAMRGNFCLRARDLVDVTSALDPFPHYYRYLPSGVILDLGEIDIDSETAQWISENMVDE